MSKNNYMTSSAKPNDDRLSEKRARWAKYGVATNKNGKPVMGGLLGTLTNLLENLVGGLLDGVKEVKAPKLTQKLIPGWSEQPTGPNFLCDAQPITPLTDNFAHLQRQVDALTANGNTNITEGVAWGMRVLSPGAPFTQGSPADRKDVVRILIVLTDGANTFGNVSTGLGSLYTSYGYLADGRLGTSTGNASATNKLMNEKTIKACDAAKNAEMEIYTINLEIDDRNTGTMLQSCASGADHYFNVPNRSQLDEAFKGIKNAMTRLKLAS